MLYAGRPWRRPGVDGKKVGVSAGQMRRDLHLQWLQSCASPLVALQEGRLRTVRPPSSVLLVPLKSVGPPWPAVLPSYHLCQLGASAHTTSQRSKCLTGDARDPGGIGRSAVDPAFSATTGVWAVAAVSLASVDFSLASLSPGPLSLCRHRAQGASSNSPPPIQIYAIYTAKEDVPILQVVVGEGQFTHPSEHHPSLTTAPQEEQDIIPRGATAGRLPQDSLHLTGDLTQCVWKIIYGAYSFYPSLLEYQTHESAVDMYRTRQVPLFGSQLSPRY
jgi:hypothetical protein